SDFLIRKLSWQVGPQDLNFFLVLNGFVRPRLTVLLDKILQTLNIGLYNGNATIALCCGRWVFFSLLQFAQDVIQDSLTVGISRPHRLHAVFLNLIFYGHLIVSLSKG